MGKLQSTGKAWAKLEKDVDGFVEALFEEETLPGMTVAVTREGRLLLSKGYGHALVDGTRKLPMTPCTRCRIGSVTKAVVTGPAGFQLMKSKNIDPTLQKLYGPKGLFGGRFDNDIDIGIKKGIKDNMPDAAKWKGWYEKITLQNLLDHRAGFIGSGSSSGAANEFKVLKEELTYEHIHRYFLRSRPIYEPGTTPSEDLLEQLGATDTYSNHGFGLWTLLIKEMSGKSYPDYVSEDYLRPMKLHNAVRPERAHPDSCDASNHKLNSSGKIEVFPFEEHGLGLAAGGFRSSAQDLLRLTASLDKKYTNQELDNMGWGSNAKGRLAHSGLVDGGTGYVTMFPKGYLSNNKDLSDIHIAILTNIRTSTSELRGLANTIALAIPESNVPADFDIWKQGMSGCSCEYVRLGVPSNKYQQVFDEAAQAGYRLEWIDGYTDDGKVHFNVIFRTNVPEIAWVSHHNMTGEIYQQKFDEYQKKGFFLDHVDSYAVGNKIFYAAIWTKSGGALTAYHGKTAEAHQEKFDSLTEQGWRPKVISVASVNGKRHYTALYTKQALGKWEARSVLTPEEYQTKTNENKEQGRHLHYLNSYSHDDKLRFSAIWAEKPNVSRWMARHGLTAGKFQTLWEDAASDGFRSCAVTGYEDGGRVRYAVYWTK